MSNPLPLSSLDACPPQDSLGDGLCSLGDEARRFVQRVDLTDGCWLWCGEVDKAGYGWARRSGERIGAHVQAHLLFIGPIADGLEVDHLCRVRNCVNPAHLEAVTREENMRRMRHAWPCEPASPLTHCRNGHEYTDDNTYVRGDGAKYCRECARVGNAVRRTNAKAAKSVADPLITLRLDSLDALVEAACADIRNRVRLGRPLPIRGAR